LAGGETFEGVGRFGVAFDFEVTLLAFVLVLVEEVFGANFFVRVAMHPPPLPNCKDNLMKKQIKYG
jgi:hypothetical protein